MIPIDTIAPLFKYYSSIYYDYNATYNLIKIHLHHICLILSDLKCYGSVISNFNDQL